jgi:hypothetical protein
MPSMASVQCSRLDSDSVRRNPTGVQTIVSTCARPFSAAAPSLLRDQGGHHNSWKALTVSVRRSPLIPATSQGAKVFDDCRTSPGPRQHRRLAGSEEEDGPDEVLPPPARPLPAAEHRGRDQRDPERADQRAPAHLTRAAISMQALSSAHAADTRVAMLVERSAREVSGTALRSSRSARPPRRSAARW